MAVTRIKPKKQHWYLMILVLTPCYMVANIIGGLTVGSGTIYHVENWNTRPGVSFFAFVGVGLLQGLLYYLSAWAIEKLRRNHEYDPDEADN